MAESGGLLNRCTGAIPYRGFESPSLRTLCVAIICVQPPPFFTKVGQKVGQMCGSVQEYFIKNKSCFFIEYWDLGSLKLTCFLNYS